jgi:hypothetical protein
MGHMRRIHPPAHVEGAEILGFPRARSNETAGSKKDKFPENLPETGNNREF